MGISRVSDREKILAALREKPLKIYDIMKRTNVPNEDSCRSLLLKMRDVRAQFWQRDFLL
jgi:hypothetical protein